MSECTEPPPPYSRYDNLAPPSPESYISPGRRFELARWSRLISNPLRMFEREWREEARQFNRDDTFRRRFNETEAGSHRYNENEEIKAQKIVMARWQEQGLSRPSWGRPWPDGDNAQSETFVKPKPGMSCAVVEFHPAIAWDGGPEPNFWKRACRNRYEELIDSNVSNPPSYPAASRPLQMFLYEVELTSKSLPADFQFAIDQYRDITAEYHETDPEAAVRRSWREDGLWSPEWSDLPGYTWPHERPDEEYERVAKAAGYNYVIAIMQDGFEHPFLQKGTGIDLRGAVFKGETTAASNKTGHTNGAPASASSSDPAHETTSGKQAAQAAPTKAQSSEIAPTQYSEGVAVEEPPPTAKKSQLAKKERAPRASALQSPDASSDTPKTTTLPSEGQSATQKAPSRGRTETANAVSPPQQTSQSTSSAQAPPSTKRTTGQKEPETEPTSTPAGQSTRTQPYDPEEPPSSPRLTERKTDDEETFDQRPVRRARSVRKDDEDKPSLGASAQSEAQAPETTAAETESKSKTKVKAKAKPATKLKSQPQPKSAVEPESKPSRSRARAPAAPTAAEPSAPEDAATKTTKRKAAKSSKATTTVTSSEPKETTTKFTRVHQAVNDEAEKKKKAPAEGVRRSSRLRKAAQV